MLAAIQPEATFPNAETACETVLLVGGLLALAWQIRCAKTVPAKGVPVWPAPWLDFGVWLWVVCCMALVGSSLAKLLLGNHTDPSDEFGLMIRATAMHGAILAAQLTMLWQKKSWSPAPVNSVKLPRARIFKLGALAWLASYPVVGLASYGCQWVLHWVSQFNPAVSTPPQQTVEILSHTTNPAQLVLMAVSFVFLAPINEELFFRTGLYRFAKSRLPARYALIIVNLLFAAAHANLLMFFPLFVLGILLTRLYERTGNIAAPMVFHALFNLTNMALILLFPNTVGPLNSP